MNFSAAWSSSRVDTPERILPASRFIVLTRIAPDAAICSISAGLFFRIIGPRSSYVVFEPQRCDHRTDVVMNLRRAAGTVDPPHQALLVVVVHEWLRLCVVHPTTA